MEWRDIETFELMKKLKEGEEYRVRVGRQKYEMKAQFVIYEGGEECAFWSLYSHSELRVKEVYC